MPSMFPRILTRIRERTRTGKYVMTIHAEEEMNFDNFSIFDVESAILNGTTIERQTDAETGELRHMCTSIGMIMRQSFD